MRCGAYFVCLLQKERSKKSDLQSSDDDEKYNTNEIK